MNVTIVFTGQGSTYSVKVDSITTVQQLKEKIFEIAEVKDKLLPKRQRIILSGKSLDDEKTMDETGVNDGSVLHLVERLSCVMHDDYDPKCLRVNVTIPGKQTHVFRMSHESTIDDLKGRIEREIGMEISRQRLMHKGKQVHFGLLSSLCPRILEEHLEFTLRTRCLIHVRLTDFGETSYDYHIPDTARVRAVREAIAKSEGFDHSMRLVYGDILDDNLTLGDYEAVETEVGRIGMMVKNVRAGRIGEEPEVFLVGGRRSVYLERNRPKPSENQAAASSWFQAFTSCFC